MKIIINQTGFTQEEKNSTHAALSALLYEQGATHEGITKVRDGEFEVANLSKPVVIAVADIRTSIADNKAANDAALEEDISTLAQIKSRVARASSPEEARSIIDELWPAL